MRDLSRKKKYIILSLALLITALFVTYVITIRYNSPTIVYKNGIPVIDPSNDRALVGFAHHVFVAEVKAMVGHKELSGFPETQYKVEVMTDIKGKISGTVIVNHEIGYRGWQLVMYEGDRLLEIGKTYLFVTRFNNEENWYTLVPVYGDLVITSEVEKENLTKRFSKAYKEQIPPAFDK